MLAADYLRQKYLAEGLSVRQIAHEAGVSVGQVRYWLAEYSIPMRGTGFGALDPQERLRLQMKGGASRRALALPTKLQVSAEELRRLYHDEMLTLEEVGRRLQVSAQAVLNRMVKEGIPVRDNDTAKRLGRLKPEVSLRASLARRGSKSHLWKGGRTQLYDQVRTCLKMKAWRQAVFERDDYRCQGCGRRGGNLHADHVSPMAEMIVANGVRTLEQAEALAALWDVDLGRTLCVACHRKTPSYGRRLSV